MKILDESHTCLYKVVKLCLILSYANATVEPGFLINSEIIEDNLKESSLASQKMTCEGSLKDGGSMEINISNTVIDHVSRLPTIFQGSQKESQEKQKLRKETFEKKKIE